MVSCHVKLLLLVFLAFEPTLASVGGLTPSITQANAGAAASFNVPPTTESIASTSESQLALAVPAVPQPIPVSEHHANLIQSLMGLRTSWVDVPFQAAMWSSLVFWLLGYTVMIVIGKKLAVDQSVDFKISFDNTNVNAAKRWQCDLVKRVAQNYNKVVQQNQQDPLKHPLPASAQGESDLTLLLNAVLDEYTPSNFSDMWAGKGNVHMGLLMNVIFFVVGFVMSTTSFMILSAFVTFGVAVSYILGIYVFYTFVGCSILLYLVKYNPYFPGTWTPFDTNSWKYLLYSFVIAIFMAPVASAFQIYFYTLLPIEEDYSTVSGFFSSFGFFLFSYFAWGFCANWYLEYSFAIPQQFEKEAGTGKFWTDTKGKVAFFVIGLVFWVIWMFTALPLGIQTKQLIVKLKDSPNWTNFGIGTGVFVGFTGIFIALVATGWFPKKVRGIQATYCTVLELAYKTTLLNDAHGQPLVKCRAGPLSPAVECSAQVGSDPRGHRCNLYHTPASWNPPETVARGRCN